jgi:HEAT repeat protein
MHHRPLKQHPSECAATPRGASHCGMRPSVPRALAKTMSRKSPNGRYADVTPVPRNRTIGSTIYFSLAAVLSLLPVISAAQNGDTRSHFRATRELEKILAEKENGLNIDLDKITVLLEQSRQDHRSFESPGDEDGITSWMDFSRTVARRFPKTTRELIYKEIKGAYIFVSALGDAGGDPNVKFLVKYLDERLAHLRDLKERGVGEDPDSRLHCAAVRALGRTKSEKAWPVLHRALRSDFSHVSCSAMSELAEAGDERVISLIRYWLIAGDSDKKGVAVRAVVSLSSEKLKPKLSKELHEPLMFMLSEIRKKQDPIIRALASTGDERVLPILHEAAQDESDYLRELSELMDSPDPWRGRYGPCNYKQREALQAIDKLSSQKSLAVLDRLAVAAKDKAIQKEAKRIAGDIRRRCGLKK